MIPFTSISRHTLTVLYILIALALLAAIAIVNGSGAGLLLLLAAGGMLFLSYLTQATHATRGKRAPTQRTTRRFGKGTPAPQLDIITPDGSTRAARVVPLKNTEGYQFVLTSKGYMLVDSLGQTVHILS